MSSQLPEAGLLNKRVQIQRVTEVQDLQGGIVNEFENIATVWASVEPVSGRELINRAQAGMGEVSHKITIRFRPDMTSKDRILFCGRIFEIVSIVDDKESHRMLTMQVLEQVINGHWT